MFVCGFSFQDMKTFVEGIFSEGNPIESDDFLRSLVQAVFSFKSLRNDLTFKDLFDQTGKKLVVAVTDLSCASIQYISYETHGDFPVIPVVVGSMSLPFQFKPVEYKSHVWVDGGLCDLFPIHLGDPKSTLGFQVQ